MFYRPCSRQLVFSLGVPGELPGNLHLQHLRYFSGCKSAKAFGSSFCSTIISGNRPNTVSSVLNCPVPFWGNGGFLHCVRQQYLENFVLFATAFISLALLLLSVFQHCQSLRWQLDEFKPIANLGSNDQQIDLTATPLIATHGQWLDRLEGSLLVAITSILLFFIAHLRLSSESFPLRHLFSSVYYFCLWCVRRWGLFLKPRSKTESDLTLVCFMHSIGYVSSPLYYRLAQVR